MLCRNFSKLSSHMARKIWSEELWEFWAVENFTLFLQSVRLSSCRKHSDSLNFFLPQTTTLIIFHPPNILNMWWWYHFHSTFFLLLFVNPENSSTSNAHTKNDLAIKVREEKLGNFVISHKLIGKSFPVSLFAWWSKVCVRICRCLNDELGEMLKGLLVCVCVL